MVYCCWENPLACGTACVRKGRSMHCRTVMSELGWTTTRQENTEWTTQKENPKYFLLGGGAG